jgi:tubulin polyglutamylase TTLL5
MKKVNSIQVSTNTQFAKQNYSSNDPSNGATIYYKMLKCDSKLVKFVFELNGLVGTDRHDWDTLWTHTTGKSYFYERLSSEQKVNHFPVSIELTRKDNLAINIRKMQEKHLKSYFSFIPETFVMPHDFNTFVAHFKE